MQNNVGRFTWRTLNFELVTYPVGTILLVALRGKAIRGKRRKSQMAWPGVATNKSFETSTNGWIGTLDQIQYGL